MVRNGIRYASPVARRRDKPPLFDLLWPRLQEQLYGVFLCESHQIVCAPFHWDNEIRKTIPCHGIARGCGFCKRSIGFEHKYYLPALNHKKHTYFALVLGETSFRLLSEAHKDLNLRGKVFVARREKSPTGKVLIDWHGELQVTSKFELPEAFDVKPTLEFLHAQRGTNPFK